MVESIAFLAVVGAVSSGLLYSVAKKFRVEEDPRIDQVNEVLPQANCGGCGYPGCKGFAEACVQSDTLDGLFCTVGGNDTMSKVGEILGRTVEAADRKIAVVRCNGSCENRPRTNAYDGVKSCAIAAQLYGGETGCQWGCYGMGDCTLVCDFDAIRMNPRTGLPEVDEWKCTACGKCVKACPKMIIELRKQGPVGKTSNGGKRVFVSCVNKDKGAVARKACNVSCIGCSLCLKECKFDAITVENNLAFIDSGKCRLCRKCVPVCSTGAIHDLNFPSLKAKAVTTETSDTATTANGQA